MTSNNEEDSRTITKWLDNPLLEPSSAQEAKEMIKWAYEVSEEVNLLTFVRGVTRLSYTRSNVLLDEVPKEEKARAYFPDLWNMNDSKKSKFASGPFPIYHKPLHEKLKKAQEIFEASKFNEYRGPESPEILIITCGVCASYSSEAVQELGFEERVGILKLGTTWPLPERLVAKYLKTTEKVLFVEEMDPFVERSVMELAASLLPNSSNLAFYGKRSGHLTPYDEQSTNRVINALADILKTSYQPREVAYDREAKEATQIVPGRPINLCAGCPHRASFWIMKRALQLDGRKGFVCGDVGCYSLGIVGPGFFQARTMHAMGSGAGVANGLGNLRQFGFHQPVLAICGDSTFYHAALPALVNGVYNKSNFTLIILDNNATAMTGFQPHPGTGQLATGDPATVIDMEAVCRAIGAEVAVCDPFDLDPTTKTLLNTMKKETGVHVIIMRHICQLLRAKRKMGGVYRVRVLQEKCLGETCGCNRFCGVFGCPGLVWDQRTHSAVVDEALCAGCGLCAEICPAGAILREEAVG